MKRWQDHQGGAPAKRLKTDQDYVKREVQEILDALGKAEGEAKVEAGVETKVEERIETKVETKQQQATLSPQQKDVLDMVCKGKTVFFTGCAGTGKSFLLQEILKLLPKQGTFVTATTGMAAVPIKGSTLHSFAGIGLGGENADALVQRVRRTPMALKRWQTCKRLIIDEVSMLDNELFRKLDIIARAVRGDERPFGGIQLVVGGDFLQLPPVSRGVAFAFLADTWSQCIPNVVELKQVFRQTDKAFVSALAELRRGECSATTLALLKPCIGRKFAQDGIEPTRLYCTKADVSAENTYRLSMLDIATKQVYTARDQGRSTHLPGLQKSCPAEESIELRTGAQVMLLKNLDTARGLVNGSRGVVTGFAQAPGEGETKQQWPRVQFTSGQHIVVMPDTWSIEEHGMVMASRMQVPLMLAYSLTIHKCQGMSLDKVSVDLGKVFEAGQAYVAMSRARSLEGLSLVSFEPTMVRAAPAALKFHDSIKS